MTKRKEFIKRCAHEGCGRAAMRDGSGLCYCHNPAAVKNFCAHSGCGHLALRDDSGFCFFHNPAKQEKRRENGLKHSEALHTMTRPSGRTCQAENCHGWTIPGSDFCVMHTEAKRPPERACAIPGCSNWTVRDSRYCVSHYIKRTIIIAETDLCHHPYCKGWAAQDGTGLCMSHHPDNIAKNRERMKGNKLNLGRHLPYLGLENIEEARGMIFYGLQKDDPWRVMQALRKIATLHARGEMHMPSKVDREQAQKDKDEYMNSFLHDVKYEQDE